MQTPQFTILLYYKFVLLESPDAIRYEQEEICKKLSLKGRILIAPEGINGTVSGLHADVEEYRSFMLDHPSFAGIEFKTDVHDKHVFEKLHVRVKPEIVHFGLPELKVDPTAANYIEPEEFRKVISGNDPDTIILDARSNVETRVGKFRNAVTLDIENFRDLPAKLPELEPYKEKKIITYCTGGIKCEKVTAWMKENGFENVHQLHGGIVRYGKEANGEGFEGSCYVFDQRVSVRVNLVDPAVVGLCKVCGTNETEFIINCANADCNDHFLICKECSIRLDGCCSEECQESPRRRTWDGRGYYLRGINSKTFAG